MIKKSFLLLSTVLLLFSCSVNPKSEGIYVNDIIELNDAISNASPGDEIIMANNEWSDVEIRFVGYGTEERPITLKAETPGKVVIKGKSDLKLGGEHLVVDGLYFMNGFSPSNAVIEFSISQDTVANHSKVTNCVILDYNKPQRNQTDLWVLFKGRHNELNHSYIAGKANRGPTVRVDLEGNKNIKNYHKITNNHFGPRPPKGGPSAETIQLGNSYTSMAPSYTLVANNLFDRCNGEVEIISSKTNFNEFRNNVFYKSEGSLVTRHGNYCVVDGNYFIGDINSEQIGGVRLIGTGHWVTNNYFYNLKGKVFRSPLAVMNGIPKSPLNRYIQVTDVVVAYNSWINCTSPWQFGVGSNTDQRDVLPASEIRSERPIRTLVANNLIFNATRVEPSIIAHDSLDGIIFKGNIINNQGIIFPYDSILKQAEFSVTEIEDNIFVPANDLSEFERFSGFEFDLISKDLFGNSRAENNTVGAIAGEPEEKLNIMDTSQYGPLWYSSEPSEERNPQSHLVSTSAELRTAIKDADYGDTIVLQAERFALKSALEIDKKLTIRSADIEDKSTIQYLGEGSTPAFEMNPKGELSLVSVILEGNADNYGFAPLKENMSSLYNLEILDSEIFNFNYVLKGYKHSFAEYIRIQYTTIKNCKNGLELSAEDDDRGDYNAENVIIAHCIFSNISKNVIDYYRGGYDESTVGGNLTVTNSTFTQSGTQDENGILIDTYGIINVNITGNTFINNNVRLVARLWGAKNNSHSGNVIENSGKLVVEENLPLKLMY
ncbi:chondroitinase-B domain-containing protein [Zeaxanthinibacter sp. PT1]|uniref:chondroitinase-B domain-containing protein n=1 Tax=Zeaxanthinibacter TaxID=561554 RepID=UPI00234962AA|nr:chondroitinase-B domain-containing protein [Zeaxanthinibacter sp. PT1]MDC6352202.1 chondroitinase-B domain-containing protein [Zeaxanthinibacter sp. PT1]